MDERIINIWLKSITIQEKIANKDFFNQNNAFKDESNKNNSELIKKWTKILHPQGNTSYLQKRLSFDNLTLDETTKMLKFSKNDNIPIPNWVNLLDLLVTKIEKTNWSANVVFTHNSKPDYQEFPFYDLTFQITKIASAILQTKLHAEIINTLPKKVFDDLHRNLLIVITKLVSKTLFHEFMNFRTIFPPNIDNLSDPNQKNQIYKKFVLHLLGNIYSFFSEYSVLTRLVFQQIDFWITNTEDFLNRLYVDFSEMQKIFIIENTLQDITSISSHLSDSHNKAQSVLIIEFISSDKIVYKPSNLSMLKEYNALLSYINVNGSPVLLKPVKILSKQSYGWIEFVSYKDCTSIEEIKEYYTKGGALLSLWYVFRGKDVNYENILAHGSDPIIIDLEIFMIGEDKILDVESIKKDNNITMNYYLKHSVLSTSFLPFKIYNNNTECYLDQTAFSNQPVQLFTDIEWYENNTDLMMVVTKEKVKSLAQNLPVFNHQKIPINNYINEFIKGFELMYNFLKESKKLLSTYLVHFKSCSNRIVIRPTNIYGFITQSVLKSEKLKTGNEWGIELEVLYRLLLNSNNKMLLSVIRSEIKQMTDLDIPYFYSYTDSFALFDYKSQNPIHNDFFYETGLELVALNLENLSNNDLRNQLKLIKSAFYCENTLDPNQYTNIKPEIINFNETTTIDKNQLQTMLISIGDYIYDNAITVGNEIVWIKPALIENDHYTIKFTDLTLYSGNTGILLFLIALEKIGIHKFQNLRNLLIIDLRNKIHQLDSNNILLRFDRLGIGQGIGSLIYALIKVSDLLQDDSFITDALKISSLVNKDIIVTAKNYDLLEGTAGLLLAFLALYKKTNYQTILEKAKICGDYLLENKIVTENNTYCWKSYKYLRTGIAHGTSGIALSLFRLYEILKTTDLHDAIVKAFAFEDSLYLKELNYFYPYECSALEKQELEKNKEYYKNSWCKGNTGINLVRNQTEFQKQQNYIDENITHSFNLLDTVCCGTLGKIGYISDFDSENKAKLITTNLLKNRNYNIKLLKTNQTDLSFKLIGFFDGLSGIGYQLIKLFYLPDLPSIIAFE